MPDGTYIPGVVQKRQDGNLYVPSGQLIDFESGSTLKVNEVDVLGKLAAGACDRIAKTAIVPLVGATIHAGVVAWVNPEAGAIIIERAIVDVTTVATGAAKLDIGTTATSAVTTSDTLLDGIDVHTATGLLEIGNGDAPGAGNGLPSQKLAVGKWVTIKEISGDATGLVGNLYVKYVVA